MNMNVSGTNAGMNQNVRMMNQKIELLKKTTPCFECGEIGHWKKQCPYVLQMQNANQNPVVVFQPAFSQLQANNVVAQQQPVQNVQQQEQQQCPIVVKRKQNSKTCNKCRWGRFKISSYPFRL